jgi:non-heme chloroperoxidase
MLRYPPLGFRRRHVAGQQHEGRQLDQEPRLRSARFAGGEQRGNGLTWATLLHYASAASEFTATPPVSLPVSSFDRLAAADQTGLPDIEMFEFADAGRMAFRRYALTVPEAPVVVLIHGSAGHSVQLHSIARAIADHGLAEAYTLDLRGHGSSPGRRGHAVRYGNQLCTDICEFLQFLDRRRPGTPIVLGGHSAGGGLVLRLCRSSAGRRLSGCFFFAPYLGLGSPTIRPLFGGWANISVRRLRALVLANVLGISWFNRATTIGFNLGTLGQDPAYTSTWSFNTMIAFEPGLWSSKVGLIDPEIPMLSLCGDKDECFFGDAYPEAFRAVSRQAEVVTVENCGHWDVLVDAKASAIVIDWLWRVLPNRLAPLTAPQKTARQGA